MRTIALSMALSAALASSAMADEIITFDLTDFDAISVAAGVTVDVTVGEDFSVVAEIKRGDPERLVIDLKSGTLDISRKSGWWQWGRSDRFYVIVTLPELTKLEGTSGATLRAYAATSDLDVVEATSGATVVVEGGMLGQINAEASSGATLRLSGQCDAVDAHASSGAALDASDMTCAEADLHASSGSSLSAYADKIAALRASSGANLSLRGGAEITTQEVSSGARISAQ